MNLCDVLRDDGINYSDYFTELVLLLFIKMVHENTQAGTLRYFNKLETGDADNDLAYEEAICRLRKMRSKEAPFSSFCVAYLDSFRHKPEYDGVLDAVYL